jgi:hypothetical protein
MSEAERFDMWRAGIKMAEVQLPRFATELAIHGLFGYGFFRNAP